MRVRADRARTLHCGVGAMALGQPIMSAEQPVPRCRGDAEVLRGESMMDPMVASENAEVPGHRSNGCLGVTYPWSEDRPEAEFQDDGDKAREGDRGERVVVMQLVAAGAGGSWIVIASDCWCRVQSCSSWCGRIDTAPFLAPPSCERNEARHNS